MGAFLVNKPQEKLAIGSNKDNKIERVRELATINAQLETLGRRWTND